MKTLARNLSLSLPLFLIVGSACSSGSKPLGSADHGADSGTPSVPSDAGSPADSDAAVSLDGGSVRRLVNRGLFGDSPVANYVVDPNFSMQTGNWYAFDQDGNGGKLIKRYEPKSPTSQPIIIVAKAPVNTKPVYVTGTSVSSGGPMAASIWVGRTGGETATVSISLLMVDATGVGQAVDLMPDPTSHPMTLGPTTWTRYSALVMTTALGWLYFFAHDDTASAYWMTGPTLLPIHADLVPSLDSGFGRRKLLPAEVNGIRIIERRMHDRLMRRPRSHPLGRIAGE
jgi:hypothetical protein